MDVRQREALLETSQNNLKPSHPPKRRLNLRGCSCQSRVRGLAFLRHASYASLLQRPHARLRSRSHERQSDDTGNAKTNTRFTQRKALPTYCNASQSQRCKKLIAIDLSRRMHQLLSGRRAVWSCLPQVLGEGCPECSPARHRGPAHARHERACRM